MPYLQTPSGKYVEVPSGLSDDDAIKLAKDQFPKLYADVKKAEEGLIPSTKSGYEALKSAYSTTFAPLFGLSDEAIKKGIERSQAKRSEIAKSKSWEDVQKAQEKYGLFGGEKPEEQGGVSSLLNMWRGQLGESLPQIGAVMGAARAGAGIGSLAGPIGTIGGGVLGALAASYPAFVGQYVERQAEEQEKAKENKPLDYGKAATAAAPAAALDVAETAFVLGRLGVGKLFASALPKLGVEKAELALVEASKRSLAGTVGRGVVAGEVIEIPTETAQAVLERWQAGLPLFDKGAQEEYIATAVGVAGPAAVFGGVGGASRRSAARDRLGEIQQVRDEKEALQQAALQQQQAALQQQQQAFQALPGMAPAQPGTKKTEGLPAYGGTQTDIFGETGGAYTPLQGQALPTGIETQTPEASLQDEYRKTKAEGDRLNAEVEAAQEQKNVPAYNAALQQLQKIEAAQSELIKTAKASNVILDVDSELKAAQAATQRYMSKKQVIPDALMQKTQALQAQKDQQMQQAAGVAPGPQADLFNLPQQAQAQDTMAAQMQDEYIAPMPPATLTPDILSTRQQEMAERDTEQKQKAQQKAQQATQQAAQKKRQEIEKNYETFQKKTGPEAEAGIAAERTAEYKSRLAKQLEALGFEQGTQQAQQLLENPLKTVLLGNGKVSVGAARTYQQVDTALNSKQLTPQVANVLGLKIPANTTYDLTNAQQAEEALKILDPHIQKLEAFRKRVFPSKDLVQNGKLTPAGKRFVRIEATLQELKELSRAAKQAAQPVATEAETALQNFPLATTDAEPEDIVRKNVSEANAYADTRKTALFDLGNIVDSLRKGEITDSTITAAVAKAGYTKNIRDQQLVEAAQLSNKIAESVVNEVSARRAAAGIPALSDVQKNKIVTQINTKFKALAEKGKPPASSVMHGALKEAYFKLGDKLLRLKNELAAMKEAASKAPPNMEATIAIRRKQLEITQLTKTLTAMQQKVAAGPIERGMTISDKRTGELAKLQRGIDYFVEALVGKKARPQSKIIPFGLAPQSEAAETSRAEGSSYALNKLTAALGEQVMAPGVRAAMREAKGLLEKGRGTAQTIEAATDLADRVVMGREVDAQALQDALALNRQALEDTSKQKNLFPSKLTSVSRETPAQFERLRKEKAFNLKQQKAEETRAAKLEAARKAKEKALTLKQNIEVQEEIKNRVSKDIDILRGQVSKTRMEIEALINANTKRGFALAKSLRSLKRAIGSVKNSKFFVKLTDTQVAKAKSIEEKARQKYIQFIAENNKKLAQERALLTRLEKYIIQLKTESEIARATEKYKAHKNTIETILKNTKVFEDGLSDSVAKDLAPYVTGTRTFVSELVPVKGGLPGTEIAAIEKRIKDLRSRARIIAKAVGITGNTEQLNPYAGAETNTPKKIQLENRRGAILDEIARLEERLHINVSREVVSTVSETPTQKSKAEALERKLSLLPSNYRKTKIAYEAIDKQLAPLKKIAAKKQQSEQFMANMAYVQSKKDAVGNKLLKIIEDAEANNINLELYQSSEKSQKNLQEVIRTGVVIGDREVSGRGVPPRMRFGIPDKEKTPGKVTTSKTGRKTKTDYREATEQDRGVDAKAAADVAARIKKALPKGVEVVYAPTLADAPQALRDAMAEDGVTSAKGAVMPDGTVVIIGEAHKTLADLEETFAHELIGHYGVDTIIGKDGMQALVDRLFKQGDAHVADVATALGVFPDVETALAALGYTRPEVDLTRRKLLKGAAAAMATPVMPTNLVKAFSSITPENAIDNMYDVWDASEKWVSSVLTVIPANLQKQANDILHTKIHAIAGEDIYNAWDNQGENWVAEEYIEDAIKTHGVEKLTANLKRAYDVAVADIVKLANFQNKQTETQTQETTTQEVDSREAIKMALVREMVAHAAEGRRVAPTFTEKVKTFVRDMVAAVRSYFRNSGLSEMAKRDAKEIQALIRESSRNLAAGRLGAYVSPDGTIAFRSKEGPRPAGMSAESWAMMHTVVAQDRSKIDEIRGNVMGLAGMTQFVDRYAPVWAALKKGVAGKKITDLEASQVRYDLSARDKIMNFTRLVAANGALEYKQKGTGANKYWMVETKNKDGANLVKVFKAIGESGLAEKDAGDMFTMYMAAQRVKNEKIGVDKLNFGKDKNGNQVLTGAKLQQFEREIAAMPRVNTAFEKARGIYNEYNKGLVDFAEQAGALSKEKADALRATKDYIPFYRENPSGEIELILGSESSPIIVGNLTDQPHLHGLVGGDTAISNIFTSAVQNTNLLTDMALRNIATGSVVDTLRKLNMLETRKYKDKKTGEQKEDFKISDAHKGANVIRFRKDGEDIAVRVKDTNDTMFEGIPPTLLVKGLEGVKTTMPKALELMGLPAQFLRRAVILSPMYPLRQVVKDSFSALGTSGANFIPIVDPFKNIYKSLTGTSREAALLESQGLLGGQVLAGSSKEALSTVLRGVVSGKQSISGLLAYAEAKSMEADVGVRLSAYNSYIKQGLNEMEAWVAANEITDFNRRGVSPSVQWANTLYPFFNAQIQGLSVFVKAMTGNMPYNERLKIQEKFKQRVVAMAAFTVMYAMAMEDDEAYKNATPEQKLNNWFVRVPGFDEPLKIPIPFEFGLLAKAVPEAIYNSVAGDGDVAPIAQALVQLGINAIPGGSSKGIPQFLVPVVESITGKDLFTGADVESARMQSLDPAQRYKDTTTELAKVLGSMGIPGVSPVKVDQFIKGVGAQTLLSAVSLADAFIASPKVQQAEKKASQVAFFSSAFQPNDAGGIINRTYELMQDGERAVNTYNKLYADGNPAEAEAYLNANMQRVSIGTSYGDFKKDMKQSTDAITEVKASDLSPREKRNRIDQLRKEQIDTAKLYRDIIRKAA